MIWLYRVLFPFVALGLAPTYLARMRRRGGYSRGFSHRFGAGPILPPKRSGVPRVWLQAVSVGEVLAIEPVLRALRSAGAEVYLTTTTSTGYRLAQDRYTWLVAGLTYFPLDWAPFSARAWRRITPDLAILTEGERWPEHLAQARRRGVRVVAINARMSDVSFRRMRRFRLLADLMLGGIDRFLAVSAEARHRFLSLGVPPERMEVTGNLKLDVAMPNLPPDERAALRRAVGLPADGLVLLGASTWPGEEEALLEAWAAARAAGTAVALLLVPRHAERRGEIEALLRSKGVTHHLRSLGPAGGPCDVAVADTTGELRTLLQLADLVFVGKSLPPQREGQTPVEAAALAKPIVFGPGMGNFRELARDLTARGAARRVENAAGLVAVVPALLADAGLREQLAAAARQWHRDNAGAMERTVAALEAELALARARPRS
jgi:3-deoxy-D-manno-octulosonic-acid transferase